MHFLYCLYNLHVKFLATKPDMYLPWSATGLLYSKYILKYIGLILGLPSLDHESLGVIDLKMLLESIGENRTQFLYDKFKSNF